MFMFYNFIYMMLLGRGMVLDFGAILFQLTRASFKRSFVVVFRGHTVYWVMKSNLNILEIANESMQLRKWQNN